MTVQELLWRLERVSKTHSGWMARCPKIRGNTRVSIDVDPQSFL